MFFVTSVCKFTGHYELVLKGRPVNILVQMRTASMVGPGSEGCVMGWRICNVICTHSVLTVSFDEESRNSFLRHVKNPQTVALRNSNSERVTPTRHTKNCGQLSRTPPGCAILNLGYTAYHQRHLAKQPQPDEQFPHHIPYYLHTHKTKTPRNNGPSLYRLNCRLISLTSQTAGTIRDSTGSGREIKTTIDGLDEVLRVIGDDESPALKKPLKTPRTPWCDCRGELTRSARDFDARMGWRTL